MEALRPSLDAGRWKQEMCKRSQIALPVARLNLLGQSARLPTVTKSTNPLDFSAGE